MRRIGLADGIGLVAVLTAIVWLPGAADPLTLPKLLFLAGGGLLLAPAVAYRWAKAGKPKAASLIVLIGAVGIVVWGLVSSFASGAPWQINLFGWWGRGDGWLAWFGAAVLLLGAAILDMKDVRRVTTWLLGGATLVALIGVAQALGIKIPADAIGGSVVGTMGNTNFAAGYFAMMGVLALGRALMSAPVWERAWGGVLFVVLAVLAVLTDSQQGPAALAAGVVALGISYALLYRGRWRVAGLAAAGVVFLGGLALLVASFFAIGPLARLWSERTFDIRQEYWQAGINIMNGLPVFGTGPDSFSRYVAEFRPESYVELLGPTLRVSAAHNVAIQYGATAGWPALILWILLFAGIAVLLIARIVRAPVASIALTASVVGAFTAYVIQGMVSIDMLPLLATGWTIAGLAAAAAHETDPSVAAASNQASRPAQTRKAKARVAAPVAEPATPISAWIVGGALGLFAAIAVGVQIGHANIAQTIDSQEKAIDFVTSPLSPCPLRVDITKQIIDQLPADVSVPVTYEATGLDIRCPPMINFQSDVAVQQQQWDVGGPSSLTGIEFDPLLDIAWVIRARYLLGQGDIAGAEAAALEAQRVQALYPEGAADPALVADLKADISTAKG